MVRSQVALNDARPIRSVVLIPNPEKPLARMETPRLKKWFQQRGITCLPSQQLAKADAVITLGGDGTILSIAPEAARAGVPVLGVNIGRLGFMTTIELRQLRQGLERWLRSSWKVSERMMLEVVVPRVKKPMLALNDAVVKIASTARVTKLHATIDGVELGSLVGDGAIVSTSTGSTAYSLAAGGPVVHPDVEAMILTPICAHSFSQQPIVFPDWQTLALRVDDNKRGNEVQLCLDGQRVFLLRPHDKVFVRRAGYRLKLFHDPRMPYLTVLREKLFWGGR